ncbi:MAG TPA: branched-chain amino acid ABC transporter permease, partial [Fervidobacterium sp.]|nr:branched-chain amino acid ABC transporter permease [Fervidobacterium sp.]
MVNAKPFHLNRTLLILIILLVVIAIWKPVALIYGLQRGGLYALIALPLALILGIIGILNLGHGDFLTLAMYIGYLLFENLKIDPLLSMIPLFFIFLALGMGIYMLTIKYVLKSGELNQLI